MNRHVNVFAAELEAYDLEPSDIVDGTPRRPTLLHHVGATEVGIWEITPGTVRDVEKDEAFIVLSGQGTVTFADGEVVEVARARWCGSTPASRPPGRSLDDPQGFVV